MESKAADGGEAAGQGQVDRVQGGALVECLVAEGGEAAGQDDRDQGGALEESVVSDGYDPLGYDDVAVGIRGV